MCNWVGFRFVEPVEPKWAPAMNLLSRRSRVAAKRRRRSTLKRIESLERRCLLHGAISSDFSSLQLDTDRYDATSVLVRYHSAATAFAQDGLNVFDSVPGLRQLALPDGLDVEAAVKFYGNHPGVVYAEPNYDIQLAAVPSDPDFDSLWGMHNLGQTGGLIDADINAVEAWDITTGDANTIVAVVDTGVDYLHPDLAANIWMNPGEIAGDGIDNDLNGFIDDVHGYDFVSADGDPMDDHDHGTHVAGTIGAAANNGIGVAGVSWDVQIMAVKFLNAQGSGSTSAAIAAIQYAVDNGATISNHSWGFNGNFSQALSDAIDYARAADHIIVAAAGNGGSDQLGDDNDARPFWPGNFPQDNLIAVAATDAQDELASFSNYGFTQVDLGAPGVGILSTTRNNSYSTFNGTSMATPHVTGAVALLRGVHPDWNFTKIRDRILDTVDPLPALNSRTVTGGRLNVAAAVAPDLTGPAAITHQPSGEVMKVQDRIRVTFNERISSESFTVDDVISFAGPFGNVNVTSVTAVPDSKGRQFEILFDPQTALGDYSVTIGPLISDPFGNPLDQNTNGVNGEPTADRYIASFTIVPDTVGPFVVSTSPHGDLNVPIDRVRVTFDEPIDAQSFTPQRVTGFTGPGGPIEVTRVDQLSDTEYEVVFPWQDTLGTYQFTIGGAIWDIAGNLIDQDQDGIAGEPLDDRYHVEFNLQRWLYADRVIDFSSQFTSTSWSAAQATGPPDTFSYGDFVTAWAPRPENGTTEFLTVGFAEPLLASGALIRETFGNGFVRTIEARDATNGQFVTVAEPLDDSRPNVPYDFIVTWPETSFPVDALRITIDTDHNLNAYEEIDAVQLRGVTVPDTDGARIEESSVDGSVAGPIERVELRFDEAIQDGTFTIADVIEFSGPEGPIPTTAVNRLTSSRYEITFPPQTVFGDYVMTIGPDILDLDGLAMNQDQDQIDGEPIDDRYQVQFDIQLFQFADAVIDFSSQFGTTSWSAAQALGPSDTFAYGDSRNAWAPARMNGTTESLTVGFEQPVLASGVQIRETFGSGFVRSVQVRDAETGVFATVSNGPDDSQPGEPVDLVLTWPLTSFPVDAVRIEIDTDQTSNFEEIDSIQLRGVPAPDLTGPKVIQSTPDAGHPDSLDHIDLVFSEPIDESTFTPADIVNFQGPDGPIPVLSIVAVSETEYRLGFPQQDTRGEYQLLVGPNILDLAGNSMDQNGDGVTGDLNLDRFELTFNLELWQYASSVVDFSSQYSTTSWSAEQALGPANTFVYGDSRDAWAPKTANGSSESLAVRFVTPVLATGVVIRETFGNGFVQTVHVRDAETGTFQLVSTQTDPSQPGAPVDYVVSWPITTFPVDAVRITIDTNHSLSFEEIDAVQLRGIVPPDVSGASVIAWTPDGGHPGPVDHIELTFDEPIDASTFSSQDVTELVGPQGAISVTSVESVSATVFRINFPPQSIWGQYSLTVGPDILDAAGNPLDQNGDGVSGQPTDDQFKLSFALELWQDASFVVDFSSQYSATSWSAEQALGPANTLVYGDSRNAWAPRSANGTTETLTVGYDTPVQATGVVIRETYGNGFVRMIEVRNSLTGEYSIVSTAIDDSQPGTPVDYSVSWPMTDYSVDAVRITVDTNQTFGFEEIDAVQLRGVVAPDAAGPYVIATDPNSTHSGAIDHIEIKFSEAIDSATFTTDAVVNLIGPNGSITVDGINRITDDTYWIQFATQEEFGTYSFAILPQIFDLAGNAMDQNQNGVGGESVDDQFSHAFEVELWQYAATVIDFSSQYSPFGWAAVDAVGAPDTFRYGDSRHAWAPRYANAGDETITLGFEVPVFSTGAVIRETYGNGFVRVVEVRDAATGVFHVMPTSSDDSLPGTPVDFEVSWTLTTFAVDAIRITIDTTHSSTYEEIDAVQLKGVID